MLLGSTSHICINVYVYFIRRMGVKEFLYCDELLEAKILFSALKIRIKVSRISREINMCDS